MAGSISLGQTETKRDANLNERLNAAKDGIEFQCERIEAVLARVNGTPQSVESAGATPVRPTMPLCAVVDHIEALGKRLADLADGVARIA